MEVELCASVFVINPSNKKILLVKHNGLHKWVQPGGHLDPMETPEDGAVREVYEETGIKVKLIGERFPRENDYIRPLGIMKTRSSEETKILDVIYYGIPVNNVEYSILDDEAINVGWFSREELDVIDVFPDIKITMDYILRKYYNYNEK